MNLPLLPVYHRPILLEARMLSFALSLLLACQPAKVGDGSDSGSVEQAAGTGSISGRVCAENGWQWLEGASVYTHLQEGDTVLETFLVTTGADGSYAFTDLPADHSYDIFIQYGDLRLMDQETYAIPLAPDQQVVLPDPPCDTLDIAQALVIGGAYDEVGQVLAPLGVEERLVDGADPDAVLAALDANDLRLVFVESGVDEDSLVRAGDGSSAPVLAAIQAHVDSGGILWVTDWSYDLLAVAFPGALSFVGDDDTADSAQVGLAGTINAAVEDEGLAQALGFDFLELAYPRAEFAVFDAQVSGASVILSGDVRYEQDGAPGELAQAPLLAAVPWGEGVIVYSSFTLDANDGEQALSLYRVLLGSL